VSIALVLGASLSQANPERGGAELSRRRIARYSRSAAA